MKIPRKIKIGAYVLDVKIVPHVSSGKTGGQFNVYKNHILLAKKVHPDDLEKTDASQDTINMTFWHEVLHGIDYAYNAYSLSEATVTRLAHGLYQVIKDNPDILKK
jgi:hypothetical protein